MHSSNRRNSHNCPPDIRIFPGRAG
jgi:hypothetical protein